MSAFMFFSNAQREKVKADNPGIAFGEVGRKLGELWRAATAEEKKEYDEQAAADKVRVPSRNSNLHQVTLR
jgi:structure-specific recognition protein 1